MHCTIQGYRMITGQSREPMMAMVSNMGRIAVVISLASSMSLGGIQLQDFFTNGLAREISRLVTGSNSSPASIIDKNLAYTQLAIGAIDAVYVPTGDPATADAKASDC
ncbi:type IV secretion system protein [Variovorax sp. J22P240]|nr:type IV secretion system protein [Variovorax sp. J22P240]MDL9998460.1 type IV secretion system protein [Variovorax sp. J22P240]